MIVAGALLLDLDDAEPSGVVVLMFLAGLVFGVAYFFALGVYVAKLGRSAILWGGLSFIFLPIGMWVSYLLCFSLDKKAKH